MTDKEFCHKCGSEFSDRNNFCTKCGTSKLNQTKDNSLTDNYEKEKSMPDYDAKSNLPWYRILGAIGVTTIIFVGLMRLLEFPYGLFIGVFSVFLIPWISVKSLKNQRKKSIVIIIIISIFISAIVFSYS